MSTSVKQAARAGALSALSPPARLTFRLSVAFAVWCVIQQAASFRSLVPPVGLVQAAIFGIIAVRSPGEAAGHCWPRRSQRPSCS